MTTPNSSPGPTAGSTAGSLVVVRRRPKERPECSLPICSRPGVYSYRSPNPERAVPTTYPVKGKPGSKSAEGVLSCESDDEDDTELLKRSAALRHELREGTQGILDFWRDYTERASHLVQEIKDVREVATKESDDFQGFVREELGKIDQSMRNIDKMAEEYDQKVIESRRIRKMENQRLHEARMEYRELRRDARRAGLR
ncbi:hypothetical protein DENSPDRAFT_692303 [Dentipellis sp. KUC8613]|nr:hypothetical protein DENSPDRAFT_692303 [Dentipellis sp. KUC8613]